VDELFEALVLPMVEGDDALAEVLLGGGGLAGGGKGAEEARERLMEVSLVCFSAVESGGWRWLSALCDFQACLSACLRHQ